MRDILFRGKSVDHNSWEYGYYFISEGRHYIQWTIKNDKMTWCQVHPETVGQFTGVFDKNGKKIFEGDLLKSKKGNVFEIRFEEQGFRHYQIGFLYTYTPSPMHSGDIERLEMEIIGNIHDSLELLK